MKVMVHFRSGARQVFIVPKEIYVLEFQKMAEKVGGEVLKVEFASPDPIPRQFCIEKERI